MLNLTNSEIKLIAKRRNIDGYKNISKKQLEFLFTKSQRSKIPIPIPRPKVFKPIPLPKPSISLPIPKKPMSLLEIEKKAVEDNIIKYVRNFF